MSGSALCAKFFLPRPYESDFDFPVGSTPAANNPRNIRGPGYQGHPLKRAVIPLDAASPRRRTGPYSVA